MQDLPRSFKVESLSKVLNQTEDPYASGKPSHPKKNLTWIQTRLKSPLTCISFAILDSQEQLLKPLYCSHPSTKLMRDVWCVFMFVERTSPLCSNPPGCSSIIDSFGHFFLGGGCVTSSKTPPQKSHNVDEWHIFYQMVHTNPRQNLNWPVFLVFQIKILTDHQ